TVMARNYRTILLSLAAAFAWAATGNIGDDLLHARDTQNLNVLDGLIAQYRLALANSYAAEVAMELRDKKKSESYAEAGMDAAKQAVAQKPSEAEYHRLLGELCGQVIPANPFFGALKYGQCAKDEID